jgi:hypothetical protein
MDPSTDSSVRQRDRLFVPARRLPIVPPRPSLKPNRRSIAIGFGRVNRSVSTMEVNGPGRNASDLTIGEGEAACPRKTIALRFADGNECGEGCAARQYECP